LNDGYEGGRLCFFVRDELKVLLSRPIGSLTTHDGSVLHAETNLTEGTRKSLFVVDVNGAGGPDVITVEDKHIEMFLAAQVSPMISTNASSNDSSSDGSSDSSYQEECEEEFDE
jgi:hypothetical protein